MERENNRDSKKSFSKQKPSFNKSNPGKDKSTGDTPHWDEPIRLNKYLSNAGICSRRDADNLIKAGDVTVNGKVVTELGVKVSPKDDVQYKNKKVVREQKVYILLNKPKDVVTTVRDKHADRTVLDIVKNACTERVYP